MTGMRLREVNASDRTIDDMLWHKDGSMSAHSSIAQTLAMFDSLQSITPSQAGLRLRTLIDERSQRRATQGELSGQKWVTQKSRTMKKDLSSVSHLSPFFSNTNFGAAGRN
jgi:hypothetical protein